MRKRLLIRMVLLAVAAIMVGAITVAAMPTPLPEELRFLYSLNAKVTDTPKHVGCASDEQIYPGTTFTVDMTAEQVERRLHLQLDGNPNWRFAKRDKAGILLQRLPNINDNWGPHPSIEIECALTPAPPQQIQVADYRKPYNAMVYWVLKWSGK